MEMRRTLQDWKCRRCQGASAGGKPSVANRHYNVMGSRRTSWRRERGGVSFPILTSTTRLPSPFWVPAILRFSSKSSGSSSGRKYTSAFSGICCRTSKRFGVKSLSLTVGTVRLKKRKRPLMDYSLSRRNIFLTASIRTGRSS